MSIFKATDMVQLTRKAAQQEQAEKEAQKKPIPTSTGDIGRPYQVMDTIFALDSDTERMFGGTRPEEAFYGVKEKLRAKCRAMGGDAVIFCQYQYRDALTANGKKQVVEIFAYGTVVKFI